MFREKHMCWFDGECIEEECEGRLPCGLGAWGGGVRLGGGGGFAVFEQ
jgi:hypothetical protein